MFHGGRHERSRRAGTENVPGIVGLGKAAELAEQAFARGDDRTMAASVTVLKGNCVSERPV